MRTIRVGRTVRGWTHSLPFHSGTALSSAAVDSKFDVFNPTDEHKLLRNTIRDFVEREVDPQALMFNRYGILLV